MSSPRGTLTPSTGGRASPRSRTVGPRRPAPAGTPPPGACRRDGPARSTRAPGRRRDRRRGRAPAVPPGAVGSGVWSVPRSSSGQPVGPGVVAHVTQLPERPEVAVGDVLEDLQPGHDLRHPERAAVPEQVAGLERPLDRPELGCVARHPWLGSGRRTHRAVSSESSPVSEHRPKYPQSDAGSDDCGWRPATRRITTVQLLRPGRTDARSHDTDSWSRSGGSRRRLGGVPTPTAGGRRSERRES